MDNARFSSILNMKVSGLLDVYMQSRGASLKDALVTIYHSRLYKVLECEETKLWHHSPMLLLDCMMSELKTGVLEFPDE